MVLSDTSTTRMIVLVRVYNPQASKSIIARKQVRVTTNELNVTESAHCTTDVCRKRHYSIRERWTAQPNTSVFVFTSAASPRAVVLLTWAGPSFWPRVS